MAGGEHPGTFADRRGFSRGPLHADLKGRKTPGLKHACDRHRR
jgi:hypothetical protein